MNEIVKCRVKVERLFFPKTGDNVAGEWTSMSCKVIDVLEGNIKQNHFNTISCSGSNVPCLNKKEIYTLVGRPKMTEKYGMQYDIVIMGTTYNLQEKKDQRTFLSFALTESQINLLYEKFEDPFKIIEEKDIQTLISVKGIGKSKAQTIIDRFDENILNAPAYIELASYGMTKEAMDKLTKELGLYKAIEIIKDNPYKLISLVTGYGWKKADAMALSDGMHPHDIRRIGGFIEYFLRVRENDGNSYTEPSQLFEAINENLANPPVDSIRLTMKKLFEEQLIWWDEKKDKIFYLSTLNLEKNIAEELLRINKAKSKIQYRPMEDILPDIEKENGWEFTDEQKLAIQNTLDSNVSIITAPAGCGKSAIVGAILQCCKTSNFAQTALAGRAAARLSEVTGEDGYTIHRLLGWEKGEFTFNKSNKLDLDIIILDEISMVGGYIFYSLVQAIKDGAKFIMIGDVGQLEAIGVLNLFKDMMDSQVISTNHLTKIHRQAAKSAIITTSMDIRNQEQIFKKGFVGNEVRGVLQDLEIDVYEDGILSQRKIMKHYRKFIEEGKNPNDIQVIVPMKARGDISTFVLNPMLQNVANPNGKFGIQRSKSIGGQKFNYDLRIGDKVINTTNNYRTMDLSDNLVPIFNGNMGTIVSASSEELVINFDQWGLISIGHKSFENIELAYAITCHKIQGSQSPYTIIGIDNSAYTMLTKEWLYTAITRAQEYCVLCGQSGSIRTAINTSKIPEKQTMLTSFLKETYPMDTIPKKHKEDNIEIST